MASLRWITVSRCALPVIVVSLFVLGKVTTEDIDFGSCPGLQEGSSNPIVVTFNATKRVNCSIALTTVTFRVVNPGHATDNICTQDVSSAATCDSTVKPGGCSCRRRVGDFWTFDFDFNFVPQRHENGTLLLAHSCVPPNTFTSNNCSDLKVAPPTTGPPNTSEFVTTSFASNSPESSTSKTTSDNKGKIIGGVLGPVAGVGAICGGAYCFNKMKKRNNEPGKPDSDPESNPSSKQGSNNGSGSNEPQPSNS